MVSELLALLNPQKLLILVAAIAAIQFIGALTLRLIGPRLGALITGFVAGFISSTALTVSLAKKSHELDAEHLRLEASSYLSATLAMLAQGLLLCLIALDGNFHPALLLFLVNIGATLALIFIRHQKTRNLEIHIPNLPFVDWVALLKLSFFIIGVLAVSKFLQLSFGDNGISILTFLISLFELHGSIIATTQMFQGQNISSEFFTWLLFLGLIASYISKMLIILFFGNSYLKRRVTLWTAVFSVSLTVSYFLARQLF